MIRLPFEMFKDRHRNETAWIVGKGETTFDYGELAFAPGPVFFINDAIQHEPDDVQSYWFAQDARQFIYAEEVKGICCLPDGEEITEHASPKRAILWQSPGADARFLLAMSRNELAEDQRLYRGRKGRMFTILPVIHFAWFCGVEKVNLIGCDGRPAGYDMRIDNRSSSPLVEVEKYERCREHQDWLMANLRMKPTYLGTP